MDRRAYLADLVTELSGPLGPGTSPADRSAETTLFLATVGRGDCAALTDLLFEAARTGSTQDLWADQRELLLQEALASASAEAPEVTLAVMAGALADPVTRGTALDVIGALGLTIGVPVVLRILAHDPSEDDLVRAAAALGEIGGRAARDALNVVAAHRPDSRPLAAEVQAALDQLDRREPQ